MLTSKVTTAALLILLIDNMSCLCSAQTCLAESTSNMAAIMGFYERRDGCLIFHEWQGVALHFFVILYIKYMQLAKTKHRIPRIFRVRDLSGSFRKIWKHRCSNGAWKHRKIS